MQAAKRNCVFLADEGTLRLSFVLGIGVGLSGSLMERILSFVGRASPFGQFEDVSSFSGAGARARAMTAYERNRKKRGLLLVWANGWAQAGCVFAIVCKALGTMAPNAFASVLAQAFCGTMIAVSATVIMVFLVAYGFFAFVRK